MKHCLLRFVLLAFAFTSKQAFCDVKTVEFQHCEIVVNDESHSSLSNSKAAGIFGLLSASFLGFMTGINHIPFGIPFRELHVVNGEIVKFIPAGKIVTPLWTKALIGGSSIVFLSASAVFAYHAVKDFSKKRDRNACKAS